MRNRGFTLIELLIVLAIIAVLVSVAAASTGNVLGAAAQRSAMAEKEVVETAILSYNTLDVAEGAEQIVGLSSAVPVKIGPNVAYGFESYLDGETEFYYWWDEEGTSLQVFYDPVTAVPECLAAMNTVYNGTLQNSILADGSTIADAYKSHVTLDSNPDEEEDLYWSVKLERLLEQGSLTERTVADGYNYAGYENPVSGQQSVINWTTLSGLDDYIPPAIFITNNGDYYYENVQSNEDILATVLGSIIYYQDDSGLIYTYHVNPDGSLSEQEVYGGD